MLKPEQRLRKQKDIETVYQSGRKAHSQFVRIIFTPAPQSESRFAVVVSQKVSKRATDRNLVKRRIRSAIQDLMPRFAKPLDIIVIAQPKSLTLTHEHLFKVIDELFRKHNLYGV